jgi:regulator of sigma E protease
MLDILQTILSFVLVIGILVTVHEFGHFWVARRLGVKVLRYSIGFGKPLLRWTRKNDETEYVLAAIPLGGYVKMLDERETEVEEHEKHRAFNRKPLGTRFAIVLAGPMFNFLLAIVAYWLMFVIGISGLKPVIGEVTPQSIAAQAGLKSGDVIVSINGKQTPTWDTTILNLLENVLDEKRQLTVDVQQGQNQEQLTFDLSTLKTNLDRKTLLSGLGFKPYRIELPPVIGKILPGEAAEHAGLKSGDRLLSANGDELTTWYQWVKYVQARPNQPIEVRVKRDGEYFTLSVTPKKKVDKSKVYGYIGAVVDTHVETPDSLQAVLQYGPGEAVLHAVDKTMQISVLTLRMLGKMVTGQASIENISGPITIARYAGYSASVGFAQFLAFLAIVSISLGVLNLLPIPLLDGGHLMYYMVEFVTRKPVSERIQHVGQQIGMVILGMLMVIAFYNDLLRVLQ